MNLRQMSLMQIKVADAYSVLEMKDDKKQTLSMQFLFLKKNNDHNNLKKNRFLFLNQNVR